jgi:hypothetical protein
MNIVKKMLPAVITVLALSVMMMVLAVTAYAEEYDLGKITNLRQTGSTETTVSVKFDFPEGVGSYQLRYSDDKDDLPDWNSEWYAPTDPDNYECTIEDLETGVPYYVQVRAVELVIPSYTLPYLIYGEPSKILKVVAKADNPMTVSGKTATVRYSKVRKRAQTLKRSKVISLKNAKGKVTYTKFKGNKKIVVNKTNGKVTVKKGLKKGTYKVRVKVKAKGNSKYKPSAVKKITFRVKVK